MKATKAQNESATVTEAGLHQSTEEREVMHKALIDVCSAIEKEDASYLMKALTLDAYKDSKKLPEVQQKCARYQERLKLLEPINILSTALSGLSFAALGIAGTLFFDDDKNKYCWIPLMFFLIIFGLWVAHKVITDKRATGDFDD